MSADSRTKCPKCQDVYDHNDGECLFREDYEIGVYEGEFENDILINGKRIFNGKIDEGEFKGMTLHGQGKKIRNNRISENGFFDEGKLISGIRYVWDNGVCVKFDVNGNIIQSQERFCNLEDKMEVLTDMVNGLQ